MPLINVEHYPLPYTVHLICNGITTLPFVQTIKTHLTLAEHVKKLKLVSVVDKKDPLWCSVSVRGTTGL